MTFGPCCPALVDYQFWITTVFIFCFHFLWRLQWRAAVDCSSAVERQQFCERVFQGGDEELGLLEALKLLMLVRAVELHRCMQGGGDVPLFCWLLFARDTSDCPRSFLSNHLSRVGRTAGLEQVRGGNLIFIFTEPLVQLFGNKLHGR